MNHNTVQKKSFSFLVYRFFRRTRLNLLVWKISIPVSFSMITYTGIMVTDTYMVGFLGETSLATAGLGGIFIWTILSFFMGLSIGVQILIAHCYGKKRYTEIAKILRVSIVISLLVGLLIGVIIWYLSPSLIPFLANGREFVDSTISFVQIRCLSFPFFFLLFMLRSFFDGLGKTYIGFISSFTSMCANIFLNWVLIFGHLGFSAYGTNGASFASALSVFPGLISIFFFLVGRENYRKYLLIPIFSLREGMQISFKIFKTGIPPALDNCIMNLSFSVFYRFSAIVGTSSVAASNLIISILSISFMPGFGFGIAAVTILGQSVAVKKYRLAYHGVYRAAHYSAMIMGTIGLLLILMGESILRRFSTSSADIAKEAYPALILVSLVQFADAYQMVFSSALRGAGMMNWVLVVYSMSILLFMFPFSWFLGISINGGTVGLWLGVSLWILLIWIIFRSKFREGSWKEVSSLVSN